MKAGRMSIRRVSRRAELDPSFFAKVLRGERNPPDDERVLRRLAEALSVEPLELLLSVGRLPAEWRAKTDRPEVLAALKRVFGAHGRTDDARPAPSEPVRQTASAARADVKPARPVTPPPRRPAPEAPHRPAAPPAPRRDLSEDLL
jgi:transcriptional regulator with XRE-family HTH domain